MHKKIIIISGISLIAGLYFLPSIGGVNLRSEYLDDSVSSTEEVAASIIYDVATDSTMQYDPITGQYIYVGSPGVDVFAAQFYDTVALQEQHLNRFFLQQKDFMIQKQKYDDEVTRLATIIDGYRKQISDEQNKTATLLAQHLDLYVCTKNRNYKNKGYTYASVELFDQRKNDIVKSLSVIPSDSESLPNRVAVLRAQLKQIPASKKAERAEKNKEITRLTNEIAKAKAEYAVMTNAKVNSDCIYRARSITTQSKKRILELQSDALYIRAIADHAEAVKNSSLWSQKILDIENNVSNIQAKYGDAIRDAQKRRAEAIQKTSECGNGQIEKGELCDDGNQDDNDYCSNQCQLGKEMTNYCGQSTDDMPCQQEMTDFQKNNALCQEKLDACQKNTDSEEICNESKIVCREAENAQEKVRQCIKGEVRCLDAFFEYVRPDMKNGWEETKEGLNI